MPISPTQRTLELLRSEGKLAEVVERWNSHARRRVDLFGFIDIVAMKHKGMWGIQCTSTANLASRRVKIKTECRDAALAWLETDAWIEIIGWSKKGPRGKRKLWTPTRRVITLEDLQ